MALEIERKFLVANDSFRDMVVEQHSIQQGYLSGNPEATVRIRVRDDQGFITVKSKNKGMVRSEWEYEIPYADAYDMLKLCPIGLSKTRYIVMYEGHKWEVDEFYGKHQGLFIAEIELSSPDEPFAMPPFIGDEVTGIPYYYNSNLSR